MLIQVARFPALLVAMLVAGNSAGQGIYTCVDAKGRKITADRPIAECNDRNQQEMSSAGLVKRVVPPSLTAQERAVLEEKEKQESEIRLNQLEERRRERALLARYPNRASHDKERAAALQQIDEVIRVVIKRSQELADQRKSMGLELEFYKNDINKAPLALKNRVEENDQSMTTQKRFLADQEAERRRVSQRFDEELAKLDPLWSSRTVPALTKNQK